MQDFDSSGMLKFQIKKDITYLYKNFLGTIEDLRNQHEFMLEKLLKELPKEYHNVIRAANFFDDNEFAYHRKKILDSGNNTLRNVSESMDKFDIIIKE